MLSPLEEALTLSDGQIGPDTSFPRIGRAPQRYAPAQAGQHAARFLAHRGRARYRQLSKRPISRSIPPNLPRIFARRSTKPDLRLAIDADPLPQPVYVDRDMWEKIVLNLLSNAFKFTFEGRSPSRCEPRPTAAMRKSACRTPARASQPDELPHLFERFRRVEGARGRSFEGSGIGLALVQELVKLHGGEIGVQSEFGSGSTFTISIPFGTAHLPGDG